MTNRARRSRPRARRGSPLAVGYGPNENYLGSDSYALKSMTNKITYLNDGEFCVIKKDHVEFFNEDGIKINKKVLELSSDSEKYDKGDYKHFMAKEIEEQPITLRNGINEYIDNSNNDINIYNFPWKMNEISSITLIGCGTAYHSCLMAKYWFEELTSLDVNVDIASEFRYRKNRFKKETLYVFVSQSGETADTADADVYSDQAIVPLACCGLPPTSSSDPRLPPGYELPFLHLQPAQLKNLIFICFPVHYSYF